MKKYKDSFETRAESLEEGGGGILTAVTNKNPNKETPPTTKIGTSASNTTSSTISPIRTLADDLEHSIKDDKVTLSEQALRGSESIPKKKSERARETNPKTHTYKKNKKNRRFPKTLIFLLLTLTIFGGSVFIFISRQGTGLGNINISLSFLSAPFNNQQEDEIVASFPETRIRVDDKKQLLIEPTTNRTRLKEMLNEESRGTQRGSLTALFPAENLQTVGGTETRLIGIAPFFEIIDISTQSTLLRNIDMFTLGVSGVGDARAFLAADVHSYEEVFGEMLRWERTMPRELYGFFHNNLSLAVGDNIPPFKDMVVSGQDARVLTSVDGEDVLIYSLVDKHILVITHSREELARIISRLQ
ncbi:MAG: hypothetical protein WDZ75_00440 [Candidatus Paceibacterota bacterium]